MRQWQQRRGLERRRVSVRQSWLGLVQQQASAQRPVSEHPPSQVSEPQQARLPGLAWEPRPTLLSQLRRGLARLRQWERQLTRPWRVLRASQQPLVWVAWEGAWLPPQAWLQLPLWDDPHMKPLRRRRE